MTAITETKELILFGECFDQINVTFPPYPPKRWCDAFKIVHLTRKQMDKFYEWVGKNVHIFRKEIESFIVTQFFADLKSGPHPLEITIDFGLI